MEINTVEKIYYWDGNFENYKVTYVDSTIKTVPHNEENLDYQEIQEWIANGGVVIDNPPE